MSNILFKVSYIGTNYCGWQRQDNALSVQEVIEDAIESVVGKPVEIFASGRTDAGVHALGQYFNCELHFNKIQNLPKAINSFLPKDIRVLSATEVDKDFHARFSAHKKTYVYRLKVDEIENPFDSDFTEYTHYNLDYELMKIASQKFVGEHNFKAFCSANTTVKDFTRTIYNCNITKTDNLFEFEITGNGFLYNMVRIIVGTIVDVSRKKLKISDIDEMFKSLDRQKAGKTMPARGLCLKDVDYNI